MIMNTRYTDLADDLFNRIKDYNIAALPQDVAYSIVTDYISPACLKFASCTQDLNDRNETIQEFNFTLTPDNRNLLVSYMIVEWIDREFVQTPSALKSRLTTTDFHALKLDTMLNRVLDVRNTILSETTQLATNKSFSPEFSQLYSISSGKGYTFGKKVY